MDEVLQALQARVREASAMRQLLCIRGAGTKDFLGGPLQGAVVDTRPLSGIIDYEPTELVITARAGTPLIEITAALAEHGQLFGFEPPGFDNRATLGGVVASGLSGPRRAYSGALRDFVLGVRLIDGRGDDLRFGGQVIKNVAGFDVSRLLAGSMGTLGILTEISLKTLPGPQSQCTLCFEMDQASALQAMNQWAARPLPISASAWMASRLYLRLSGAAAAIRSARQTLGGEPLLSADEFWTDLREQRNEFFRSADELWRLSVPSNTPMLIADGPTLIEWGGALRWLSGPLDGAAWRVRLEQAGGHARLYRGASASKATTIPALNAQMLSLHQRLKAVFDPNGLFNSGRLAPGL